MRRTPPRVRSGRTSPEVGCAHATRRDGGFTLVEMMIVVAIIAILVTIALGSYANATARARRATCLADQRTLEEVALQYQVAHGSYPDDLEDLETYIKNDDTVITCPSDSSLTLDYDPDTGFVSCPNHPGD